MVYLITFPSTHQALNFEKNFKSSGLSFTLRPVPREISSSCGIAAQIETDQVKILSIWEKCATLNIATENLYEYKKVDGVTEISCIKKRQAT